MRRRAAAGIGHSITKLATIKAVPQQYTSIICCTECCNLTGSERQKQRKANASEGRSLLTFRLCTSNCGCIGTFAALSEATHAQGCPSALRSGWRHHAWRGERGLRRGRLRAHEADAGLREERLDDAGRLQRPPPRDARVHILQEVVAVPCACSPVTSSQHHCSG